MTNESIADAALNSSFPTKVIIHGYRINLGKSGPGFIMKDEFMKNGLFNVIIVNWSENNKPPYYQAVANARAVGAQVAKLLNLHVNHKGLNPDDIHIIGHSLGGQIAGWIGERIPNLGRITGLDPAGPYFQDAEREARLDETDAKFVDVIHSNGGSYGIGAAIGHIDFFPNGGRSQPGCRNIDFNNTKHDFLAGTFISDSCSHSRAVDYFTASINQCEFLSNYLWTSSLKDTMKVVILFIGCIVGVVYAIFPDLGNIVPDQLNPLNIVFQNKCIEDLGCFHTGPPFFHPLNRPISLTPTDNLKTKFLLYTPSNIQEEQEIVATSESINNSSFDLSLPTKVLIHGFRSDLDVEDIRFEMKDALLSEGQFNVIVVDWTENNGFPYTQAVANARAVGAQVAKLINFLRENKGIQAENVHIIGHSLGGHVAGYAGERIPNLGRITGLDPAGPLFQSGDKQVRLDETDANFVDIIHSDGGENVVDGLGLGDPIGHIDFYPNGGRRQPGCSYTSESNSTVGAVVNITTKYLSNGCDHERANQYFLESINNQDCRFLAVHCHSYVDYEQGLCPPDDLSVLEMGLRAHPVEGLPIKSKFFLRTNDKSPFCIENSIRI
ncbi:pancreatic lipase-related protein 2-like [Uloborus diversus]|uniref:pancreatic lipase-related protein 2-like n=1 Tax=Uloborus diversus TaxID=327109 RepID=UPI002409BB49|nr:pancreatic lipase-related protein 2-like [Uloborus diversus]